MESPRRRIAYSAGSTVRATPNRPPSPATRRKCRRWTCDVETRVATRPGVLANHRKAAVPPVGRTGPLAGRTCSCHRSAPNSRLVCRSEWLEIPGTVTVLLSARIAWACSHLSSATLISRSRPRLVRKKSIEGALPNRSCLLRHRLEGCLTWPRLAKRKTLQAAPRTSPHRLRPQRFADALATKLQSGQPLVKGRIVLAVGQPRDAGVRGVPGEP